jgi:hypothetical protein
MTDIICPLCGKPNPPDLGECKYCQAPLKVSGFLAPSEQEGVESPFLSTTGESGGVEDHTVQPGSISPLDQAIPDWLKETEANFLKESETKPEEPPLDDL